MAFKENRSKEQEEIINDSIRELFTSIFGDDFYSEDSEPEEVEVPTEKAAEEIDLDELSNTAKLVIIVSGTLNDLITGKIELENAAELLQLVEAVSITKQLVEHNA
jgi:predicted Zn-dependent protease with MMP-like domain